MMFVEIIFTDFCWIEILIRWKKEKKDAAVEINVDVNIDEQTENMINKRILLKRIRVNEKN